MDWPALVLTRAKTSSCIVESVHDGDTLRAICDDEQLQVRLHCIDAPEIAQAPWGQGSRDHLRAITPRQIQVQIQDTDRYGRKVAEILTPEGISLNQQMVRDGKAAVYQRYCSDPDYARAELEARARGLGIWSTEGEHQTPWDYRNRSG
jgi:endonuclease YncB( thermonuclease family)